MTVFRCMLAALGVTYVMIQHTQRVEAGATPSAMSILILSALIVAGVWYTVTDPLGSK